MPLSEIIENKDKIEAQQDKLYEESKGFHSQEIELALAKENAKVKQDLDVAL